MLRAESREDLLAERKRYLKIALISAGLSLLQWVWFGVTSQSPMLSTDPFFLLMAFSLCAISYTMVWVGLTAINTRFNLRERLRFDSTGILATPGGWLIIGLLLIFIGAILFVVFYFVAFATGFIYLPYRLYRVHQGLKTHGNPVPKIT